VCPFDNPPYVVRSCGVGRKSRRLQATQVGTGTGSIEQWPVSTAARKKKRRESGGGKGKVHKMKKKREKKTLVELGFNYIYNWLPITRLLTEFLHPYNRLSVTRLSTEFLNPYNW
jgi:hypothetical protein